MYHIVSKFAGPSIEGPPGCEGFACILYPASSILCILSCILYPISFASLYPCIYILLFLYPVCCMLYPVYWIQPSGYWMLAPRPSGLPSPGQSPGILGGQPAQPDAAYTAIWGICSQMHALCTQMQPLCSQMHSLCSQIQNPHAAKCSPDAAKRQPFAAKYSLCAATCNPY